jgi:hypothetical protein
VTAGKPPYSPSGEGSETAENVTYHQAAEAALVARRRVVVSLGSGDDYCRLVGFADATGPIHSIETADGVMRNVGRWHVVQVDDTQAPGPSGGDPAPVSRQEGQTGSLPVRGSMRGRAAHCEACGAPDFGGSYTCGGHDQDTFWRAECVEVGAVFDLAGDCYGCRHPERSHVSGDLGCDCCMAEHVRRQHPQPKASSPAGDDRG